MCLKGTVQSLETELIEAGFDGEQLLEGALSDHRGLLTKVVLKNLRTNYHLPYTKYHK